MGASSYSLLDAANSNTIRGFLQHGRRRSKKTTQSWRVSGGLSALAHEPAQTTEAGKTKTESKPQTRKHMQTKQSVTNLNNHQPSLAVAPLTGAPPGRQILPTGAGPSRTTGGPRPSLTDRPIRQRSPPPIKDSSSSSPI